eukprot:6198581-Pleurochrysis_carterae.AAC.2
MAHEACAAAAETVQTTTESCETSECDLNRYLKEGSVRPSKTAATSACSSPQERSFCAFPRLEHRWCRVVRIGHGIKESKRHWEHVWTDSPVGMLTLTGFSWRSR